MFGYISIYIYIYGYMFQLENYFIMPLIESFFKNIYIYILYLLYIYIYIIIIIIILYDTLSFPIIKKAFSVEGGAERTRGHVSPRGASPRARASGAAGVWLILSGGEVVRVVVEVVAVSCSLLPAPTCVPSPGPGGTRRPGPGSDRRLSFSRETLQRGSFFHQHLAALSSSSLPSLIHLFY